MLSAVVIIDTDGSSSIQTLLEQGTCLLRYCAVFLQSATTLSAEQRCNPTGILRPTTVYISCGWHPALQLLVTSATSPLPFDPCRPAVPQPSLLAQLATAHHPQVSLTWAPGQAPVHQQTRVQPATERAVQASRQMTRPGPRVSSTGPPPSGPPQCLQSAHQEAHPSQERSSSTKTPTR